MDKWDLQTIKEILVRKKSKKLWILKNLNVYKIYRITYSNLNSHPVTKKLKKKSKKLWILKKDYSKMKLVSCFRGLDCLSLRHLDVEEKVKKIMDSEKGKDAEKKKDRCWNDGICTKRALGF